MDRRREPGRQRDGRSLNYLLGRYGVEIRTALVRRYGAQQDGIDDALQQAFLRFSTLETQATVADPRAFLFVMARNALKDAIRRSDSQKRRWRALAETAIPQHEISPEEALVKREEAWTVAFRLWIPRREISSA